MLTANVNTMSEDTLTVIRTRVFLDQAAYDAYIANTDINVVFPARDAYNTLNGITATETLEETDTVIPPVV